MDNTLRILLVEDDKDDAELLEHAFRENSVSFKMDVLSQGDKAIPFLKSCSTLPHVIVIDLNLPKLHGKEILRRIREEKNLSDLPVVVLSTSSMESDREYCLSNGAKSFLVKPTTAEGFDFAVRTIVSQAGFKS